MEAQEISLFQGGSLSIRVHRFSPLPPLTLQWLERHTQSVLSILQLTE
jgi:hypothetical protein